MTVKIGDKVPPFSLEATSNLTVTEQTLQHQFTVLYFYPKDNTPGCTNEGLDFTANFDTFQSLNAQIFGISKDSLKKHENFKEKYNFPFELICDENEILCHHFDVIKLKKNYGREYLGIERSTFLIDPNGKLVYEWRKIRVKDHVNDVLNQLRQLQAH